MQSVSQPNPKSKLESDRLDAAIAGKYSVTFRTFNPDRLNSTKAKVMATISGDLRQIAGTLIDNAMDGRPWTNFFELHQRAGTGGPIAQSTARKADINHLLRAYGLGAATCIDHSSGQAHPFYRVCFEDEVLKSETTRNFRTGLPRVIPYTVGKETASRKAPASVTPQYPAHRFAFGRNSRPETQPVQDGLFSNTLAWETGRVTR